MIFYNKPGVTIRPKTAEEMARPPQPFGDPAKITRDGDKVILDIRENEARLQSVTDPEEESWTTYIPWSEYKAEGITHVRCSDGLWTFGKHGRVNHLRWSR